MRTINTRKCVCPCCMEEHEIQKVCVNEQANFKNVDVEYEAEYMYCDKTEELYADEEQLSKNDILMKEAYRKKQGLLTSQEISKIRQMYDISQGNLCTLLGWGQKTITRYEGHQIQDRAHDMVLRKIGEDPEWFIELLEENRKSFPVEMYYKYLEKATEHYEEKQDYYLQKTIEAKYAKYYRNDEIHGNTTLSLEKVVSVIRYFAEKVDMLDKIKLMNLIWYADVLSYQLRGYAITGLIYQLDETRAVPIAEEFIIDLKDVPCKEVKTGETYTYFFKLEQEDQEKTILTEEEKHILDIVINKLGKLKNQEIVSFVDNETGGNIKANKNLLLFRYTDKNLV